MSAGSSSLRRRLSGSGARSGVELEVRDLRERVDAGVGPARAVELELPAPCDLADGAVNLALDGAGVLLDLPAAVARPGVLDDQLEPRHQRSAFSAPAIRAAQRLGTNLMLSAPILFAMPGIASALPAIIAS